MSLKLENHAQKNLLDHGFQEDNALEGHHVKGQNSVMDSKRSSLDGRTTFWKDTMSRVGTGVSRSSYKISIEEITMSTTALVHLGQILTARLMQFPLYIIGRMANIKPPQTSFPMTSFFQ
jgi:hypothetical protein